MTERTKWAAALLIALAANAFLFLVILLQSSGILLDYTSCKRYPDGTSEKGFRVTKDFLTFGEATNIYANTKSNTDAEQVTNLQTGDVLKDEKVEQLFVDHTESGNKPFGLRFVPSDFSHGGKLELSNEVLEVIKEEIFKSLRDEGFKEEFVNSLARKRRFLKQRRYPSFVNFSWSVLDLFLKKQDLDYDADNASPRDFPNVKATRRTRRSKREVNLPVVQGDSPRRSDVSPEDYYSEGRLAIEEVFSTLTDTELNTLSEPVQTLVMPALIHFEGMIIRQLETLHGTMVGHDLRLENLEKAHLNWLNSVPQEPQSDAQDNRTGDEDLNEIIEENYIPVNSSNLLTVIEGDGSGDGEADFSPPSTATPTSTTTASTSTTTENKDFYQLFRAIAEMEMKVSALENYNVMSDSELKRARNEVIKMDDKVAELDRRHRNLQIRTAMQIYRTTELEAFMGKTELALHTTLDAFSRMGQRLDAFKDRMSEYKKDVFNVKAMFTRQDQIMGELRSADSYKAHDINELRKSLHGLEERLNSLYRVLDQNVDTIRGDVRSMIDRLCFSNNLAC